MSCDICYQPAPNCMRTTVNGVACTFWPSGFALEYRDAGGHYPEGLRRGFAEELSNVDDVHLDHLFGHTETRAEAAVMSAADAAFRVKLVDGALPKTEMGDAANYVTDHPKDWDLVKRNVNRLIGDCTALQVKVARSTLEQAEQARVRVLEEAKATPQLATTAAEYKQKTEPWAALFQQIVKRVETGDAPADDGTSMFDPLTGKTLIPFEKAKKISSGANLVYSVHLLIGFWTGVMKKAPQVYQRFMKMIVQVVGSHGFTFSHKFTDALLRKLDEGFFTNPVSLMLAGEHNVILDSIVRVQTAKSAIFDTRVAPRQNYGQVTTPINGPGAALIFDHMTKAPKLCTRFHASPQQDCTAGVMPGHSSDKAGWCMFAH